MALSCASYITRKMGNATIITLIIIIDGNNNYAIIIIIITIIIRIIRKIK